MPKVPSAECQVPSAACHNRLTSRNLPGLVPAGHRSLDGEKKKRLGTVVLRCAVLCCVQTTSVGCQSVRRRCLPFTSHVHHRHGAEGASSRCHIMTLLPPYTPSNLSPLPESS